VRRPRLRILSLLLAVLSVAAPAGAASPPFLVRYSFDDGLIDTGPDTFTVFRNAKGSVQFSTAFHVSGYRALEIRDVAGDGDFPELQGFFPVRRDGRLFLHFALLTTDPRQELNVAMAGPGWFDLTKDGMALWFIVKNGVLRHVSDRRTRHLLKIKPFTWYGFDVDYDVARGRYDLLVTEEGNPRPVVSLKNQPNASAQAGAAVYVFSFIGDLADKSNVVYYLDDVVLGSDPDAKRQEFVAPGRRKFFVDLFAEQASQFRRLRLPGSPLSCPPVLNLSEAGLSRTDLAEARAASRLEALEALLTPGSPAATDASAPPRLQAVALWKTGCVQLAEGQAEEALKAFDAASRQLPEAGIFGLSRLLALTSLKRWQEVDDLLVTLHPQWGNDPRYALASALIAALRAGDPEGWKRWRALGIASEQSFHLALLEGRTAEARDYALQMAKRLADVKAPSGAWLERAGDAAFARRDLAEARQLYGQAKLNGAQERSILLKLADVHYLLGDLAAEKALREAFYGSLDPR
jgi:hypothetical protein